MRFAITLLLLCATLSGCASARNPKDPLEPYNRAMYQVNDTVDKAVLKPVAKGYVAVVPPPVRMMLSNIFSNIEDVIVTFNDVLQLKLKQAAKDAARVTVNTTFGLLGVADIATPIGLEKHDEDFGQTLGYWGVGSGPYVVLPLLGPSSVRDSVGLYADSLVSPVMQINHIDVRNEVIGTAIVDKRASLLDKEEILNEAATDRYAFIRDAYLERRQNLVYDGNPPRKKYDDEEDDGGSDKGGGKGTQPQAPSAAPDKGTLNDKGQGQNPSSGSAPAAAAEPAGAGGGANESAAVYRIWPASGSSHLQSVEKLLR